MTIDSASSLKFTCRFSLLAQQIPKSHLPVYVGFVALLAFSWIPNSYSLMVGWPYVLIWQSSFFVLVCYTFSLCRRFHIPFTRIGYGLDSVFVLILASTLFSSLNAPFRAVAFWNFLLVLNYIIILYLLVNWLRSSKVIRHTLWRLVSSAGSITCMISLVMWRPNSDMWLSKNFHTAIRNAQPLGHHNFVGGYALLLLPLVLGLAVFQKGWRRWITATASFVIISTVYVSGSRGALIGLLLLGIITFSVGIAVSKKSIRRRWIVSGVCFALLISVALLSNPRIRTLFSTTPTINHNNNISVVSLSDGPTKDRIFMLESAKNVLVSHPILGVGPGNLSRVYNNYRPLEAGAGLSLVQQLHNTPAQIAAELGLLGFTAYIALIAALSRLSLVLYKALTNRQDRILLFSVCACWLGYSISSLSDYQLENIGISITLVSTVALAVNLADSARLNTTNHFQLQISQRRFLSLCLLLILCTNFQFWIRTDVGLYLSHMAVQDAKSSNLVGADRKWDKASQLVPWDPTYPALAGEAILELMNGLESDDDIRELRILAIEYYKKAVEAAPNDPWFNQNLATLLIENNEASEAESYAREAIRLSPRDRNNYTYYTLGRSFLKQGKNNEAIESFVSEALANPIFLTARNWEQKPFLEIKDDVVNNTLESYQQILSDTNQSSRQYSWLYEQWAMLSWWHGQPISAQEQRKTRPLVQAMLVSNQDVQYALQLIDKHIDSSGSQKSDISLIQARLSPHQYLPKLLDELNSTLEEKKNLEESIERNGSMQDWLSEVTESAKPQVRYALVFAYRNLAANVIRKIIYPGDIQTSLLLHSTGLFTQAPREYPQLDRYLENMRSEKLSVHH